MILPNPTISPQSAPQCSAVDKAKTYTLELNALTMTYNISHPSRKKTYSVICQPPRPKYSALHIPKTRASPPHLVISDDRPAVKSDRTLISSTKVASFNATLNHHPLHNQHQSTSNDSGIHMPQNQHKSPSCALHRVLCFRILS